MSHTVGKSAGPVGGPTGAGLLAAPEYSLLHLRGPLVPKVLVVAVGAALVLGAMRLVPMAAGVEPECAVVGDQVVCTFTNAGLKAGQGECGLVSMRCGGGEVVATQQVCGGTVEPATSRRYAIELPEGCTAEGAGTWVDWVRNQG